MTDDKILEIKSRLSLEQVVAQYVEDLRPVQGGHIAICPFPDHEDSKPSFKVYPDGHYYCYGCRGNGDIFDFVREMEGWDFPTTLRHLAKLAGVSLKDDGNRQGAPASEGLFILDAAQSFFMVSLEKAKNGPVGDYLARRGLTEELIDTFGLGYAPASWQALLPSLESKGLNLNKAVELGVLTKKLETGRIYDTFRDRLMFPIQDFSGRVVGFGGRVLDDKDTPKYLNSKESPVFKKGRLLYGLHQARKAIRSLGSINLVEGYTDVLSLAGNGYKNSAGYLGTAFTREHAAQVAKITSKVNLIPDGDAPGRKAAFNATRTLLLEGIISNIVRLPSGEDCDSLLKQSGGKETLENALHAACSGLEFIAEELEKFSIRDRSKWASDFLNECPQKFLGWLIPGLANALGISEFEMRRLMTSPPTLFDTEQKVLQFLSSYPAYIPMMIEHGVERLFISEEAQELWGQLLADRILEGMPQLHLTPSEVRTYWNEEIRTIFDRGLSA